VADEPVSGDEPGATEADLEPSEGDAEVVRGGADSQTEFRGRYQLKLDPARKLLNDQEVSP
jgi:hypothetical protein